MYISLIIPKNVFPKYHNWVFLINIRKRKQGFLQNLIDISEGKNIQNMLLIANKNTFSHALNDITFAKIE